MAHHSGIAPILVVATALLGGQLSGCNSGNDPLPQVSTPDPSTANQEISSINVFASDSTRGPNFATALYVDASSADLVGDGKTDNTAVLLNLLGNGNRTIHIPAGDYVIGKLYIPSNTVLILDSGTILQDSGQLGPEDRLINIESTNVYISGYGAKVLGNRNAYSSGEQRHGVCLSGANNVVIDGLESSNNAGDGFYIGGGPNPPSQNIVLNACLASNNKRQGLSIIDARNLYVVNCQFQYTQGTAPELGIDLEPDLPTQYLDHIKILQAFTLANHGGGIGIYLENLNANSYPVDIEILDHRSDSEWPPFATSGSPYAPGNIQYTAATD